MERHQQKRLVFCVVVGRGRNVVFVRCESYLADTAIKMEARVGIEPA